MFSIKQLAAYILEDHAAIVKPDLSDLTQQGHCIMTQPSDHSLSRDVFIELTKLPIKFGNTELPTNQDLKLWSTVPVSVLLKVVQSITAAVKYGEPSGFLHTEITPNSPLNVEQMTQFALYMFDLLERGNTLAMNVRHYIQVKDYRN